MTLKISGKSLKKGEGSNMHKGDIQLHLIKEVEINRFLLVNIIGLMESLLVHAITIHDAQATLFSPHTVAILKKKGVNKAIVQLILEACELEDVESLLPKHLEETIIKLKYDAIKLLKCVNDFENKHEITKWIMNK